MVHVLTKKEKEILDEYFDKFLKDLVENITDPVNDYKHARIDLITYTPVHDLTIYDGEFLLHLMYHVDTIVRYQHIKGILLDDNPYTYVIHKFSKYFNRLTFKVDRYDPIYRVDWEDPLYLKLTKEYDDTLTIEDYEIKVIIVNQRTTSKEIYVFERWDPENIRTVLPWLRDSSCYRDMLTRFFVHCMNQINTLI